MTSIKQLQVLWKKAKKSPLLHLVDTSVPATAIEVVSANDGGSGRGLIRRLLFKEIENLPDILWIWYLHNLTVSLKFLNRKFTGNIKPQEGRFRLKIHSNRVSLRSV